jgi:hypothetical protein
MINLDALIDPQGKALLSEMHRQGSWQQLGQCDGKSIKEMTEPRPQAISALSENLRLTLSWKQSPLRAEAWRA